MKNAFDALNLSPQERRLVVGVMVVVFVLLNFWLVWPHFSDWKDIQAAREEAKVKLARYEKEAALKPALMSRVESLEENSPVLPPSDQAAVHMERAIRRLARESSVTLGGTRSVNYSSANRTNEFFEDHAMSITIEADDQQLVSFLHALGASNSLIRVRDMSLRPNQNKTRITGDIVLVASYQRETTAGAASAKAK